MESTALRSQVATDVWNAWRHRKAGGFISAGAQSVGISDFATALPAVYPSKPNLSAYGCGDSGDREAAGFLRVGPSRPLRPWTKTTGSNLSPSAI